MPGIVPILLLWFTDRRGCARHLTRRLAHVGFADDVVTLEHRPRLVPAVRHRDTFRHATADHVANGATAQVMEKQARVLEVLRFAFGATDRGDRIVAALPADAVSQAQTDAG